LPSRVLGCRLADCFTICRAEMLAVVNGSVFRIDKSRMDKSRMDKSRSVNNRSVSNRSGHRGLRKDEVGAQMGMACLCALSPTDKGKDKSKEEGVATAGIERKASRNTGPGDLRIYPRICGSAQQFLSHRGQSTSNRGKTASVKRRWELSNCRDSNLPLFPFRGKLFPVYRLTSRFV